MLFFWMSVKRNWTTLAGASPVSVIVSEPCSEILNFKNYGSNSSRTHTVVIGVSKEMSEYVAPIELYSAYVEEMTLGQVTSNFLIGVAKSVL